MDSKGRTQGKSREKTMRGQLGEPGARVRTSVPCVVHICAKSIILQSIDCVANWAGAMIRRDQSYNQHEVRGWGVSTDPLGLVPNAVTGTA